MLLSFELAMLLASSPIVVTGNSPQAPHVIEAAESVHAGYPADSLRRGEEGTVNFVVFVDRKSRISSCQVAKSSGYAALDRATCDTVIKNGRFRLDERGDRELGGRGRLGVMSWVLPASVQRPETAPPFSSQRQIADAGAKIICKYSFKAGSQIIEVKQCHSRRQWARAELNGREEAVRLTVGGGTSGN